MTNVCISIIASTIIDTIKELKEAEKIVDLIEIRIDFITDLNNDSLKQLLDKKSKKVIITCRSKYEEGQFEGSEIKRIGLLKKAIEFGADFIDIEDNTNTQIIKEILQNKNKTKIILSHHYHNDTPTLKILEEKYNFMNLLNPDFIKIVTKAKAINDCFSVFKLLKGKNNLISFCMGIRGSISRVLAPKYGSYITYVSLKKGKESASGQISIAEIENNYNISKINLNTKILGVIGTHAENSKSKYMHNANFKTKNLNYIYVPFKVRKSELNKFMINFRDFNFSGAAVTVPHKETIINFIDKLDETAKIIGATNTLVNNNNCIVGSNTDYFGAITALKKVTSLNKKKILVIGAGGAARALLFGLNKENASIMIVNRTYEHAQKLGDEFNTNYDKFENIKIHIKNSDIIINTTNVGMSPNDDKCIISKEIMPKNKILMDMVYNPINTLLIKRAKENNCTVITGDKMLAYQAIQQFKTWTNIEPDFKLMQEVLLKNL